MFYQLRYSGSHDSSLRIVEGYTWIWHIVWEGIWSPLPMGTPSQPRWLSGLRHSRVHSLMIARRSLSWETGIESWPGQYKGHTFSGWHGLNLIHYSDLETLNSNKQTYGYQLWVICGEGRGKEAPYERTQGEELEPRDDLMNTRLTLYCMCTRSWVFYFNDILFPIDYRWCGRATRSQEQITLSLRESTRWCSTDTWLCECRCRMQIEDCNLNKHEYDPILMCLPLLQRVRGNVVRSAADLEQHWMRVCVSDSWKSLL